MGTTGRMAPWLGASRKSTSFIATGFAMGTCDTLTQLSEGLSLGEALRENASLADVTREGGLPTVGTKS